jgi:hypothetical protein
MGLDRFVAASYGAHQQVNRQVERAIVDYQQTETTRLAKAMPRKVITVTQDETFTVYFRRASVNFSLQSPRVFLKRLRIDTLMAKSV